MSVAPERMPGAVRVRLAATLVACACVLVGEGQLDGQAPPPPPPPPGAAAVPLVPPPPPPPVGTQPEDLPAFEVASVKKLQGPVTSSALRTPGGGRITIVNLPLRTIIMQAWGIRDYQLIGAPGWIVGDRFSINAKAEGNAPRDQLMLMVRRVLAERFQMKYRGETREMSAYVLTAPPDWKPNDRMRPVDCTAGRGATPPPAGPIRPETMPCGGTMLSTAGIQARGVTIASFVSLLGSIGGLGVVHDRTGLTGTYHIELDASPTALIRSLSVLIPTSDNLLPSLGEGPSLGSAIQDLGLKLERRREPVDVLVIESISQPDED